MKQKLVKILLAVFITASVISGCGVKSEDTAAENEINKPTAVSIVKVKKTSVASVITLNGKVKPVNEVSIVPKIAGKVSQVNFEEGQSVKKGDILFTLEDKDIRLQVKQAEAALSLAKVSLIRAKGGSAEQQISQLKSALVAAETNYSDAKLNYERTKQLYSIDAVSKQTLEMAETRFKVSEDQYRAAKTALQLTETKINQENIAAAEAQVNQAQAAYEMAKSQLDNTVISSPITGVVASKSIKVGEMASGAMAAMSVVDLRSAVVEIGATENIINNIKVNDKVQVAVNALGDKYFEGKITVIAPVADPKTQSYLVKIEVPNSDGLLKGGMFAEIRLSVNQAQDTLAVPLEAVINDAGKKIVYIAEGNKAVRKEVKIGFSDDKSAQILEGLGENQAVIVKGQSFLQDGSSIIVTDK